MFKKEQQNDQIIRFYYDGIKQNRRINYGRLKLIRNQLRMENELLTKAGRPIIPATLRQLIVSEYQNMGHFGVEKTHTVIKERFYWYGMYKYIHSYVRSCKVCIQTQPPYKTPKAPLQPIEVDNAPMRAIAMDIATLKVTEDGFRYLLVMGDMFTKFTEAEAMKDQTADSVMKAFYKGWVCH